MPLYLTLPLTLPPYFWVGTAANVITTVIAAALFLLVLWLGPKRRENIFFCLYLLALMLWTGASIFLRIALTLDAGDGEMLLRISTVGFGALGVTVFTFATAFYEAKSPALTALVVAGFAALVPASYAILRGMFVTAPVLLENGIIMYTVTPLGRLVSSVLFAYMLLALGFLVARWRQKEYYILAGTAIILIGAVMGTFNLSPFPFLTINHAIGSLLMGYAILKFQLLNPLLELNQELEVKVAERTADLMETMREKDRLSEELAIARRIQVSLLPQSHPPSEVFDIYGRSIPAEEVGGDFYTYQRLGDGRLGVAVGDVSGKGMPAAILMAVSTSAIESYATTHDDGDVAHLLMGLNRALFPRLKASRMNTALLYALMDERSREVHVCNAGLISPLLCMESHVGFIDATGMPLGAMEEVSYYSLSATLRPGSLLLLLSDGPIEARNAQGEMFGFARLERLVASCGGQSAREIADAILGGVQEFIAPVSAQDDMTLVVVKARD